jgi:hypothetical protein
MSSSKQLHFKFRDLKEEQDVVDHYRKYKHVTNGGTSETIYQGHSRYKANSVLFGD